MCMASWSPFMGVHDGSLRAVVGLSWVGRWVLLITCDHSGAGVPLLWAASVVVVVGALLVAWGAWLVMWHCHGWGWVCCCCG